MKWNILGINLEEEIHSYDLKCFLITKWLLNYSKIVIPCILNSNESQSSLVEMSGVSWSKRNVIKLSSVIKSPCNQGQQNTELPSDILRLIFFLFLTSLCQPSTICLFTIFICCSELHVYSSVLFFSPGTARKNSICITVFWVSAAEDIWNRNKSVCICEHIWWRQKNAIKIWKISTLLSVSSIKFLRISTLQIVIEFNDNLKVKKAPGWGLPSSPRQLGQDKRKWSQNAPGTFRLNITKNLFSERVAKHWNRLAKEMVEPPPLEVLMKQLDMSFSAMV